MNFIKKHSLPLFLSVASLLLALFNQHVNLILRYDRESVSSGEVWRLLSAHLIHGGVEHLVLNLLALAIIWILVKEFLTTMSWWLVMLFLSIGITLSLYVFMDGLDWYVGLSGLLHGLLVAGAICALYSGRKEFALLLLFIFIKIGYEQFYGSVSDAVLDDEVATIVNAHLYGVIFGVISAFVVIYFKKMGGKESTI